VDGYHWWLGGTQKKVASHCLVSRPVASPCVCNCIYKKHLPRGCIYRACPCVCNCIYKQHLQRGCLYRASPIPLSHLRSLFHIYRASPFTLSSSKYSVGGLQHEGLAAVSPSPTHPPTHPHNDGVFINLINTITYTLVKTHKWEAEAI